MTFHGHTFDTVTHETNEMSEMNRQGTAGGGLRAPDKSGFWPRARVRPLRRSSGWGPGNDGPAGKVHPFSRQIASEAACVVTALD